MIGRAAHRVDVAEGVGGRDLAVDEGVVHDRREKVDRLHDREVRREPVHARVIVRLGPDQEVRVAGSWVSCSEPEQGLAATTYPLTRHTKHSQSSVSLVPLVGRPF